VAAVEPEATIQVRGDAVVRAGPDEAIVWITLTELANSPGAALSDVAARAGSLSAVLDELQIAQAERTTTGVTVYEEFDHARTVRRSLGHRATAQVSVRFTDPELIGRLISRAGEELGAQIRGPQWQIARDNPARLEAARDAARDAERKARAYAEGIGARLGRPVRLAEPEGRFAPFRGGGAVAVAAAGGLEPMPIEPGEHEVIASIQVTFALERP
jgi:uncharacterized protein YggE